MKLANLAEWGPYPYHLQNPNGRMLATAADLLKHHGYTHLANELQELANDLLATIATEHFGVEE